jgi:hypothetical protein
MGRLRGKLTYANVISTLCLFLLLGGGAYAASHLSKNSVGTKQLKNNSVTAKKLKNGSVTGAKVLDGSLTGADIKASTLGTVPQASNADKLGGVAASGFVQGGGHAFSTSGLVTVQASSTGTVLEIPGFGAISLVCSPAGNGSFSFTNHSGATMYGTARALNGGAVQLNIANGAAFNEMTSSTGGNIVTFQGATLSGPPKLLTFTASNIYLSGNCAAAAQAQTSP